MYTKLIDETISPVLNPKAQQTWDPAVQPCLSLPSMRWLCSGPFLVDWCTSLSPKPGSDSQPTTLDLFQLRYDLSQPTSLFSPLFFFLPY